MAGVERGAGGGRTDEEGAGGVCGWVDAVYGVEGVGFGCEAGDAGGEWERWEEGVGDLEGIMRKRRRGYVSEVLSETTSLCIQIHRDNAMCCINLLHGNVRLSELGLND